jgi:putative RNA 2'-phosphotransferase
LSIASASYAPDVPDDPPYPQAEPPEVLWHAVPVDRVGAVLRDGLTPDSRPHVHLARHPDHARAALRDDAGPAAVLRVEAGAMHAAGLAFFISPKTTWLTHEVPPAYLRQEA